MNKLGLGFLPILWLVLGCRDAPPPVGDPYFAPPALVDGRFNVAILVTDGVSNTEIAAPSDVFGQTQFHEGIRAMNVFTVSEKKQPGRAAGGLRFLPDFDFSDAPKTDILVVPGAQNRAGGHIFNQKTVDFVEKMGKNARFVLALGNGTSVLARARLLDEVQCTNFPGEVEKMREMFPKLQVLEDISFVHDGNCITSMGGARSFEAALYLCERLYGKKTADQIAHGLGINWDLEETPNVSPDLDEPENNQ